jgi:hypothetical protein
MIQPEGTADGAPADSVSGCFTQLAAAEDAGDLLCGAGVEGNAAFPGTAAVSATADGDSSGGGVAGLEAADFRGMAWGGGERSQPSSIAVTIPAKKEMVQTVTAAVPR